MYNPVELSGVTLQASSPNAAPLTRRSRGNPDPKNPISAVELRRRFLDVMTHDRQPLVRNLSGLEVEYRILHQQRRLRMIPFGVYRLVILSGRKWRGGRVFASVTTSEFWLWPLGFIAWFLFVYEIAAADEASIRLGWLQLRGWRAVLGGLAIYGIGVVMMILFVLLVVLCEHLVKA